MNPPAMPGRRARTFGRRARPGWRWSAVADLARVALLGSLAVAGPLACDGVMGKGGGKGPGAEGKKGPGPDGGGPQGETAMQVKVVRLKTAPIERWYQSSGTLEAIRSAELVAVQPAIIESVLVDEGDEVQEGQLLARLDGRAASLQADAARVELQNLEAELKRLESVSSAAISREEIDKQRYLVEQARASVKLSRHTAKQTVVRAPFSGTIVTRYVDEGNFASTSTPLFHLADLRVLELPLHLPEKDAATVTVGSDVEIELVDGTTFTAKIERRSPVVDPLTGTVKFTIRTRKAFGAGGDEPKGPPKKPGTEKGAKAEITTPPGAAPGAFARAKVLVDRREAAPSLPREAVFQLEGKPHVFVVADGKAQRREVKPGLEGSDHVEILGGLASDEPVVAEGNAGITEGMPLVPVEAEPSPEVAAVGAEGDEPNGPPKKAAAVETPSGSAGS
jgi:membrane fusion protein (multidrug efflux system)